MKDGLSFGYFYSNEDLQATASICFQRKYLGIKSIPFLELSVF